MRLGYHGAKKYVQMECANVGLGIIFHQPGTIPGPHTDGRNLHVFEPNALWTDDQWDDWEYEVYHEIGHEAPENCHPHWKEMLEDKGISVNTLLGRLWNLMSDHVQEHNRCGVYSGRDRVLKRGRSRFVFSRLLPDELLSKEQDTKVGRIFKVASLYDTWRRENWNEYLRGSTEHAADLLEGEEKKMWNALYNSGINIEEGKNEVDSYEFAKAILAALGEDPEKHEKEAQEARKAEKAGGDGDGEAGDKSKGGGEKTEGALGGEGKEEVASHSFHTHYEKTKDGQYSNNPTKDMHIEYENSYGYRTTSFTPRKGVVIDMSKDAANHQTNRTEHWEKKIESINAGKVFANQVKRLLISMKQQRWSHGQKRGHISSKNLWKAKGPIYQDDVFKKRDATLEINTAVTILTDNSGSMAGEKFSHAARAGLMLHEAMSKVGVPTELLSFSDNGMGPINIIVKPYSEMSVSQSELTNRYACCSNFMQSNSDGESIEWAALRLAKRKEKRRLLIVLSDGSPASSNGAYGDEVVHTSLIIKKIEEETPLEIYGLGIMDNNVSRLYREYKVINHANELESMLLGLVKQKVMK